VGLVHYVVSHEKRFSEICEILQTILRNPQHALSQAKKAVRAAQKQSFMEGLKVESDAFGQCFKQDYFIELMRRQLKEGTLKTTAKLPDWIFQEGKESV
jgi:enoyl-CoA hydratase/carnithine racemase